MKLLSLLEVGLHSNERNDDLLLQTRFPNLSSYRCKAVPLTSELTAKFAELAIHNPSKITEICSAVIVKGIKRGTATAAQARSGFVLSHCETRQQLLRQRAHTMPIECKSDPEIYGSIVHFLAVKQSGSNESHLLARVVFYRPQRRVGRLAVVLRNETYGLFYIRAQDIGPLKLYVDDDGIQD